MVRSDYTRMRLAGELCPIVMRRIGKRVLVFLFCLSVTLAPEIEGEDQDGQHFKLSAPGCMKELLAVNV